MGTKRDEKLCPTAPYFYLLSLFAFATPFRHQRAHIASMGFEHLEEGNYTLMPFLTYQSMGVYHHSIVSTCSVASVLFPQHYYLLTEARFASPPSSHAYEKEGYRRQGGDHAREVSAFLFELGGLFLLH